LDPWPLDEGPRPKKQWLIQAKPTWHHFGGIQDASWGPRRGRLKNSICFK